MWSVKIVFNPKFLVNHKINAYKVLLCLLNGFSIEDIEKTVYNLHYSRLVSDLIDLEKNKVFSKIEYNRWNIGDSNFKYELSDKLELLEINNRKIFEFLKYKDVYAIMIDFLFMFNERPVFKYNAMVSRHLTKRVSKRNTIGIKVIKNKKTYNRNNILIMQSFYDKIELYRK